MMRTGLSLRIGGAAVLGLGGALVGLGASAAAAPPASVMQPVPAPGGHHGGNAPTFPVTYDGVTYGWASSNWAGYAVTNGPYTSISGSWTIPTLASSHNATSSATWLGIDGFDNASLIQTGVEQDYYKGAQHDTVWWTTSDNGFAEQSFPTTLTVSPGDEVTASIAETGPGTWTIGFTDETTGVSSTMTGISYSGPLDSAEWVVENPGLSANGVHAHEGPFANYGKVTFDHASVGVDGGKASSPGFVASTSGSDAGLMIEHSHVVSAPSLPDSDNDGFSVAYGSTPPATPTS